MTTPPFNCLSFDGIDDYLDCGTIDIYQQSYTVEVWFKTTANNTQCIFSATLAGYQSIWMGMEDGKLTFSVYGDKLITNDAKNDGQWHHVAIVLIVAPGVHHMRQIYIDGIFVVSKDYSGFYAMGGWDTTIGRSLKETSSLSFNGEISEVRIWKKARTEQEIKTTKDQLLSGTETDLGAYWTLGSTDVNQVTVNDKAGTANATIKNATWKSDNALTLSPPGADQTTPPEPPVQADPPSEQTTATSTDTPTETDPVAELLTTIAEGDWRKQIVQDAKKAITNGALEMKDNTFQGFNLLKSVTDILFDAVKITDVNVELVTSAALEKVEGDDADTGKSATADTGKPTTVGTGKPATADTGKPTTSGAGKPATVGKGKTPRPKPPGKRFRLKTGGGVKISGKTDILGLVAADIALEFSISDTKEKDALIKIKTSESEGSNISEILGGSLPKEVKEVLSVLSDTQLLYPSFAFSTSSVSDDEDPFDVGIDEGFNFYGKIKLTDFKSKKPSANTNSNSNTNSKTAGGLGDMLGFIADVFKIEEITARLCIKKREMGGLDLKLDAVVEQDLEFSSGNNLKIVFQGAVISLAVGGSPPEPSITIGSSIELTISYIGAENLSMTGSIQLDPESISPSFTLEAMDKPFRPFGFSGLSIQSMAVVIGATYMKPYIDNFGVSVKKLQIGDFTGSMGLMIDTNDYDKFVFSVQTPKITFWECLSAFSPTIFVAYQALPDTVTKPLETVVNCEIKDMELSVIPAATTIGTIKYDKEGITARGEMNLWGWKAKMDAHVSASEIDVSAEMDAINLTIKKVQLLNVTGAEPGKKPAFELKLGLTTPPEFMMSLDITILSVNTKVDAKADIEGLRFILKNTSDFGEFSLASLLHDKAFYGSGKFNFQINEKIPLGKMGAIQLNVGVNFDLTINIESKFKLSLKGDLKWMNKSVSISYEILEPLPKFEDVPKKLIEYLKKNAAQLFAASFKTLAEWADAVGKGAIFFTGKVAQVAKDTYNLGEGAVTEIIAASRKIGETSAQISRGLKDYYGWNAGQVATALKAANYTIDEVTNGLKSAYKLNEKVAAQTLKSAGYTAQEVVKTLESGYNLSMIRVTQALKATDYSIDQVATGLKTAFYISETEVVQLLKDAGYTIDQISKTIQSAFKLTKENAAKALHGANYTAAQVAGGLKAAYTLTEKQVAQTLKGVNHSAEEVAKALQQTYGAGVDTVTVALKGAGYKIDEVTDALDYGLNVTESSIRTSLQGAGYTANQINQVIAPLNPSNWLPPIDFSFISSFTNWMSPIFTPWNLF